MVQQNDHVLIVEFKKGEPDIITYKTDLEKQALTAKYLKDKKRKPTFIHSAMLMGVQVQYNHLQVPEAVK